MKIRKATKADIPGIVQLINDNLDKLLPRDQSDMDRLLDTFFVLDNNGTIVGCSCLEIYSPKIAEIRSVAVATEFRARGYGKQLVQAVIDEANSRNIREIMVVTSNLEFYQKLNFSTCLKEKYALFYNK